jgi:hypothetical protein
MKLANLLVAAALVLVPAMAPAVIFAQAPQTTTPVTGKAINERKTDQQDRIAQGVKSGQLTAGETAHLEHQEASINKEESGMRAQDNGHLTKTDKSTLTKQQNQESRRIHGDKHNSRKR